MTKEKVSRVSICDGAAKLLQEMAEQQGVTPREYLEALLHYAGSCHKRPGSWEACQPFDFASYDNRTKNGQFADRWF